jgi:adenylate kinase
VCEDCKAVYNLSMLPEGRKAVCDACGGKLVTRPDDKEETVRRRLKVYNEETSPVIDFYRRSVGVIEIGGTGDLGEITAEILRSMK